MEIFLNWHVYMIRCSDNSLYTGITSDMDRRFKQHCSQQGAKYFRSREPQTVVYIESGHSRITASRRENAIKKLNRSQKLQLIAAVATAQSNQNGDYLNLPIESG